MGSINVFYHTDLRIIHALFRRSMGGSRLIFLNKVKETLLHIKTSFPCVCVHISVNGFSSILVVTIPMLRCLWWIMRFKKDYGLWNLRALKFSPVNKMHIFQCMDKIFLWNFKGNLWNATQNILPIHWKIWFLYNIEILRALGFKSS